MDSNCTLCTIRLNLLYKKNEKNDHLKHLYKEYLDAEGTKSTGDAGFKLSTINRYINNTFRKGNEFNFNMPKVTEENVKNHLFNHVDCSRNRLIAMNYHIIIKKSEIISKVIESEDEDEDEDENEDKIKKYETKLSLLNKELKVNISLLGTDS